MANPCLGKLLHHMLEMSCYLVKASIHGCVSTCCSVGAGLREEKPGAREWDVGEKESGERELGEVREKKLGQKEPVVAPGIGTKEHNRYAVTITGVSATGGSACGIICIQQVWDASEGSHLRAASY